MSDKQNFYIDPSLLNTDSASGGATGVITRALKYANENIDDFIQHTKQQVYERSPEVDIPKQRDYVIGGTLKHNLYVDFGMIKIFASKGTKAELSDTVLRIEKPPINISFESNVKAEWRFCKNDFNRDELCIILTNAKDDIDG